jgi:hypothetical protein
MWFSDTFKQVDAVDVSIRGLISSECVTSDITHCYLTDDVLPPRAIQLDAILSSHGCELSNANLGDLDRYFAEPINPYTTVALLRRVEGSVQGASYNGLFYPV